MAGFAAAWNQKTTAGKATASANGLPSQQADDPSSSSSSSSLVESVKQQLVAATATHTRDTISGAGATAAVADGSIMDAVVAAVNGTDEGGSRSDVAGEAKPRVGPVRQLKLLLSRSWKQATRDKGTNMSRVRCRACTAFGLLQVL